MVNNKYYILQLGKIKYLMKVRGNYTYNKKSSFVSQFKELARFHLLENEEIFKYVGKLKNVTINKDGLRLDIKHDTGAFINHPADTIKFLKCP